jgi:chemotaxis signal transduction protein
MSTNITRNYWYEPKLEVEPSIEFLTFKIGEISLGVSIDKIHQVINADKISTLPNTQLLDLHHRLFGISSVSFALPPAIDSAYYIIIKNNQEQLFSIPVDTAPTLMTIGIDRIRHIPHQAHTTNILEISSHVATIDDSIVFILDI